MSALPEFPNTNYFKAFSQGVSLAYTANQMLEYGDARAAHARKQALEEAAKAIIEPIGYDNYTAISEAAMKIRSLK